MVKRNGDYISGRKITGMCVGCTKISTSASLFQVTTKAEKAGYIYVIVLNTCGMFCEF